MTLLSEIGGLLSLLFIIYLLRDLIPRISNKYHSNLQVFWPDNMAYCKNIKDIACDWLLKPPLLTVHDATRGLLLDDFLQRKNREEVLRGWPMGLLAKGIMVSESASEKGGLEVLRKFYDQYLTREGSLKMPMKYVDDALHGEILLFLYSQTRDLKYSKASAEIASRLLANYRQTRATLPYRKNNSVRFVDTLGMIVPFLFQYGTAFGDETARDLALLQMEEFILYGVEKQSGLPFHGYNPQFSNIPIGLFSWGRGVGWYAMGLSETLIQVRSDHPKFEFFKEAFTALAKTIGIFQKAEGGWGCVINNPSSRYDSSGTAMIIYALKKAMSEGLLNTSYQEMLLKGFVKLQSSTSLKGVVFDSQGVCMAMNNHSTLFSSTPYAQGMALAAAFVMNGRTRT